jgi:hypothetical protein
MWLDSRWTVGQAWESNPHTQVSRWPEEKARRRRQVGLKWVARVGSHPKGP